MEGHRRLAFAVTAAALVAFAACRQSPPENEAAGKSYSNGPELSMGGLKVQSYGLEGLQWEMTAPRGEAFTARAMMRVDNLHVELFENKAKSTDLTADKGIMYTGDPADHMGRSSPRDGVVVSSGDMYLDGNVVIVSTDGNKLSTDWVHYRQADQIIVSCAPVTMIRQNSITRGVGLRATPDLNRVEIYNQTLVINEDEGPGQ